MTGGPRSPRIADSLNGVKMTMDGMAGIFVC